MIYTYVYICIYIYLYVCISVYTYIHMYFKLFSVFQIPFWYWKDRRTGIHKTLQVTQVDFKPWKSAYNQNCRSRIMQICSEREKCILKDTHKRKGNLIEFGWKGNISDLVLSYWRALPWCCRCSTCSSESFAMLFTRLEQGWSGGSRLLVIETS